MCINFSDQEVNTSECDPDDRPPIEQDCAMSQCLSRSSESRPYPSSPNGSTRNNLPRSQSHQWRTGPWGAVRHFTHSNIASQEVNKPIIWGLTSKMLYLVVFKQTLEHNNWSPEKILACKKMWYVKKLFWENVLIPFFSVAKSWMRS